MKFVHSHDKRHVACVCVLCEYECGTPTDCHKDFELFVKCFDENENHQKQNTKIRTFMTSGNGISHATHSICSCGCLSEYMRTGSMYAWCACHSSFTFILVQRSNDDWRSRVRFFFRVGIYIQLNFTTCSRLRNISNYFVRTRSIDYRFVSSTGLTPHIIYCEFDSVFSFLATTFFYLFTLHLACTLHRVTQLWPLTYINRLCK